MPEIEQKVPLFDLAVPRRHREGSKTDPFFRILGVQTSLNPEKAVDSCR